MIKLLIKLLAGILSIPVALAVSISFYNNIILIKELAGSLNFFLWGIGTYVIIHLLFYKPTYLYVLGHETVHAGIAWLFGGKIKKFKVSGKGGSVATDKSNFLVELGPYFVPIYAIIITVVYFVISSSYNINGRTFIFLIGFALAFHLISTIEVMKIRQPDIVKSGYFFSVVLIYVLNIIVISVIFGLLFPSFSIQKFFVDCWLVTKHAYLVITKQMFF